MLLAQASQPHGVSEQTSGGAHACSLAWARVPEPDARAMTRSQRLLGGLAIRRLLADVNPATAQASCRRPTWGSDCRARW